MHVSTKFDFHEIPNHEKYNIRLMVNIESKSKSDKISNEERRVRSFNLTNRYE
jgi:hypothetical protein